MKHAAVIIAAALALAGCDFTPATDPASLLVPGREANTSPSLVQVTGRRKQLYKRSAASYIPSEITNSAQGLSFTVQTGDGVFAGYFDISDTFHNFFFNPGMLVYSVITAFPVSGTFSADTIINTGNRAGNLASLNSFSSASESIVTTDSRFAAGTLTLPASGAYESPDSEHATAAVTVPLSTTLQRNGGINITLSYNPSLQRNTDVTYTPLNKYIYTEITAAYAPDTAIKGVMVHDIVQSHAVNGNEITFTLKAYTENDLYAGYVASILLTAENGELSTEYLTIE
jgi:hypothetical protein